MTSACSAWRTARSSSVASRRASTSPPRTACPSTTGTWLTVPGAPKFRATCAFGLTLPLALIDATSGFLSTRTVSASSGAAVLDAPWRQTAKKATARTTARPMTIHIQRRIPNSLIWPEAGGVFPSPRSRSRASQRSPYPAPGPAFFTPQTAPGAHSREISQSSGLYRPLSAASTTGGWGVQAKHVRWLTARVPAGGQPRGRGLASTVTTDNICVYTIG